MASFQILFTHFIFFFWFWFDITGFITFHCCSCCYCVLCSARCKFCNNVFMSGIVKIRTTFCVHSKYTNMACWHRETLEKKMVMKSNTTLGFFSCKSKYRDYILLKKKNECILLMFDSMQYCKFCDIHICCFIVCCLSFPAFIFVLHALFLLICNRHSTVK